MKNFLLWFFSKASFLSLDRKRPSVCLDLQQQHKYSATSTYSVFRSLLYKLFPVPLLVTSTVYQSEKLPLKYKRLSFLGHIKSNTVRYYATYGTPSDVTIIMTGDDATNCGYLFNQLREKLYYDTHYDLFMYIDTLKFKLSVRVRVRAQFEFWLNSDFNLAVVDVQVLINIIENKFNYHDLDKKWSVVCLKFKPCSKPSGGSPSVGIPLYQYQEKHNNKDNYFDMKSSSVNRVRHYSTSASVYDTRQLNDKLNAIKSESSGLSNNYGNSTHILNMFNTKRKKDNTHKVKLENNYNYIGKPRHYPPANKEWFNSIYVYNNNTIKLLPTIDKVTHKLVKSYFNFYSRKLEKKIKSRRLRIRGRRLSTNRILISRPELKHTNDKVIVTVYVYNRQKKYYFNKLIRLVETNNTLPNRIKIKTIKKKSLKIKSGVKKQKKIAWKTLGLSSSISCSYFSSFSFASLEEGAMLRKQSEKEDKKKNKQENDKNKPDTNKLKNYETTYLKDYILRCLRKEMLYIYLLQLVSFNVSKFENRYLLPLISLVRKVYNKKVEFNFVNLKNLYLNSYIFAETLVTKIRNNKKNRLLRVLNTSLLLFNLPDVDRPALYEEIYNRKRKIQNLKVDNTTANFISLKHNIKSQFSDLLERTLLNTDPKDSIYKLRDFKSRPKSLIYCDYPLLILNTILKSIRNKYVSGIRLEVAGRLTRRNKAARSVFKLRYKGNIQNMDSSYKGLSTVLLRGYAKANLQYTKHKSWIRIGSFGLKSWVSSSS